MVAELVSWVLRNARLHAQDPQRRTGTWVAAGDSGHPKVHPAQIGRWETGRVTPTLTLVRRYEDLLGYPEGTLQCTADLLHRTREQIRTAPSIPDPDGGLSTQQAQELLERALSTDRMSGIDWYRLSGYLGTSGSILMPEHDWRALLVRGTREMAVSLNLQFALRHEALARLASHPGAGPAITHLAEDTLADPHAQVYTDVVSLIEYGPNAAAVDVLERELAEPTNNDSLRAALITVTALVRRDGPKPILAGRQAQRVAHACLNLVRDEGRPLMVRRQAAHVLRVLPLPPKGRQRLATGLSRANIRYAASIVLEGRSLERARLRALHHRIRDALLHEERAAQLDPVLDRVLHTALEDSDEGPRGHALGVLMLLPQKDTISTVLASELRTHIAGTGEDVAIRECLDLLTWLASPDDLEDVLTLLLDDATSPDLALSCGIVVGNARPTRPTRARDRQGRIHARAAHVIDTWPGVGPCTGGQREALRQILRGLVYPLGITGRFDLIKDLRDRADHAEPGIRQVAAGVCDWWLRLPRHIRPL